MKMIHEYKPQQDIIGMNSQTSRISFNIPYPVINYEIKEIMPK